MLRYSGSFTLTNNMIKAIEYCEICLKFCEDAFVELNSQDNFAISINDKQISEQIKQSKSCVELEEIARNNSLLDDMYNKRLLKYLLMDFCIYVGQSLSNMKQFNPQVAFCLARKPFCETLCYLEKMLLNPKETVDLVFSENSKNKDIDNRSDSGVNSKDTYLAVIKLLNLTDLKESIYNMRYAKKIPSIRAIGDRAMHIATSGAGLQVRSGELNFIFMDDNVIKDFSKLYCKILPLVMCYAVYVVKNLFKTITGKEIDLRDFNKNTDEFFGNFKNEGDCEDLTITNKV